VTAIPRFRFLGQAAIRTAANPGGSSGSQVSTTALHTRMHRCEFCKILLSYANVDKIMQNFA
jgi:hypothetical protein